MTPVDDGTGDMRTFPMGDSTADALLEGRIAPDDAPFGFERVAALVRDARSPATAGELANVAGSVAAVVPTVREAARMPDGGRGRRKMLGKLISAKVVAAAAAAALGGGVAAAATGSLPTPVQSTVSSGLSHIGISLPNPDSQPGSGNPPAPGTTNPSGTAASVPSAPGPAITAANEYGLCTAYAASQAGTSTDSHSVGATDGSRAFIALKAAATAKGETVAQFCTGVTPPGRSGTLGSSSTAGAGSAPGSTTGSGAPGQAPPTNPAGRAPGVGNPHTQRDVPPAGSTGSSSSGSAVTPPAGITPGSPPSGAHGSASSSRP